MTETKEIAIKNGEMITLSAHVNSIKAHTKNGVKIGELGFDIPEVFHSERQYIDLYDVDVNIKYQHNKIATKMVLFAKETFDIDLITAPHHTDSMKLNGNMLTTDGANFIHYLRDKGIVAQHPNDREDPEDNY
ncbi:MAG: hypothetical protein COC24_013115 [Alphaproteobacteria bacterium]|nr:hypothetical protein [Alphaproteobacteria bacterium]